MVADFLEAPDPGAFFIRAAIKVRHLSLSFRWRDGWVRTPDGRHKITQRDGLSTTSLARLLLGELALERVRGGWWRRRQRGEIEQNVPTCGNIE